MNIDWSWISTSTTASGMVLLSALGIYVVLITYTRLVGLRSYSKMSSFDFAVTVAMGSVVASVIVTQQPPLLQGAVALGSLYLIQYLIAFMRPRIGWIRALVDNEPVLLMVGERMLEDNMRRERVTRHDLYAKLREANVLDFRQVRAVVLETTGDVSVLHGPADGSELDPQLLEGVRDASRFTAADRDGAAGSATSDG